MNILYSDEVYNTRKSHVVDGKKGEFKYPLINTIDKNGVKYRYTRSNDLGHFGVPKLIFHFNKGVIRTLPDLNGMYGMTQNTAAIGILATPDIADMHHMCDNFNSNLLSDKFATLIDSCNIDNIKSLVDIMMHIK